MMANEQHEGDLSEISSLTDSSDEGKKVVEEVVETVEEADKPAYSEEDLETLVGFIRGMIILFDYDDEDFNEEVAEVIKLWLMDANNPLLFIFYDGNRLTASLAFPLCPINDLMYFMREQEQLFSVLERFHDDILFGTLHGDIEGSLLVLLEQVYGPMILSNQDWSENVKTNVINGFNAFMTYLTELHYKLSGFTLLYVPREGSDMEVQEVVLNRSMIKRLEAVVIDWTGQIRATLSDTQHFVPDDLVCPSDEYSFWLYRHEVLSAIRLQYKGPNVQHIVRILELAQSLYIKHLKDVLADLDQGIAVAESNIPFLKLLVDPCFAIGTLETADDFSSQLIYVMHIIRFIGQDSSHLNRDESMTKLFLYLSNEIVACCMRGIDVARILAGAPRYGIEVCNMKINCCESYKIIYEEMLEHFKEEFPWNLDYAAIFNRINAFLQRLHDILEICDAMLIFGKYAESTAYTSYRFFCNNAEEFERRCDQVEKIFHNALETIESVGGMILDINNKDWYRYIGEFREMLKSLDDIIENLLSNVFMMSENLEEKLNVLVTLLNFYKRENIKESFMRKIGEVWGMLNDEIMQLSKDISAGISQYPALLPPYAGRYAVLKMRFDNLAHLRTLIVDCRFFPDYPQQEEVLALYEACEKQVKGALKGFYEAWCKSITTDMASWYQRNLICRSNLRPGLFEVNIERRLLLLFDEAHCFKTLGVTIPMSLDLEKHENTRLTFDNVLRLVLYFNGVVSSISDKERLFFKPMIQQTERKLEPMRSKLTWEEDLSEFIEGYVTNVRELLDLIELYKRENQKISLLVERMYGLVFFRLEQPHPVAMAQLMASVTEQKKTVFTEFLMLLTEISQNIFTIYDSLGSNVRKMVGSWEQYLLKIDKLLKAAVFTCTLNTLRGVRTAIENVHGSPILMIEILLKPEGAVYEPSVEAVEKTLRRLVEEVSLTIKSVPSMTRRYQLESAERSFYLQLLEHPEYMAISCSINETIDDTVRLLHTYQAKWNVFRPFWCVDKAAFIERFKLSAMTSEAFQRNIEKFEELQNQLSTQGDFVVCRCVEIDALKLKYGLTSHISEWQTKYVDYLKCVAYGKIIDFNHVLKQNVKELRHEPKEVHELKRLEERYKACFDELPEKEQEITIILGYFVVLEKYVVDLLPEAYQLRHNIDQIWAQYRADMKEIREQIENYQDQFKLSMTGAADALKVDALEMLKMLRQEMQTSEDSNPTAALEAIDQLMIQLEELERREREIEERMLMLGVAYVRLPALREIRSTLENLRFLWLLVEEWRAMRMHVMSEQYQTVDELELRTACVYFSSTHESLGQRMTGTDECTAFLRLGEEILQFTVTSTVVSAMRSSFLQDRHWHRVNQIVERDSETNETQREPIACYSSFNDIFNMRLFRYEKELLMLCHDAREEHEVELDLEAVSQDVRAIEFKVRQPVSTNGFPELLHSCDNARTIANNICVIDRLRGSRHRHPFQSLIDYWEQTLGLLEQIFALLVQTQSEIRALFELHRLGSGSNFSSTMSVFREKFRSCFSQWCELLRYASSMRPVEDICPVGQEYVVELEAVRKHRNELVQELWEMLQAQRQTFPRFYLLSNRQLIELMSCPSNVAMLERVLNVLFENVSRFSLASSCFVGVRTRDDECIPFAETLPLVQPPATVNAATETLHLVESGIRRAMQDALSCCFAALRAGYFHRVESGWLSRWPLQLCLKSAELQNTRLIGNALAQCSLLGSKKPLKMLRSLHAKLIGELIASTRSLSLDRWMRRKLNDLLIVELNASELIGRLYRRPEQHGPQSFEWVSQLHSHWHPGTRRCTMQLLDARFPYGYECKRSVEPVLLTPVSERARMTTLYALKTHQIPLFLGTAGASCGRRVLLNSLAHSLGVFLHTLECQEKQNPLQMEALLHVMDGMRRLGGWLALSGLERLSQAVLTQIAEGARRRTASAQMKREDDKDERASSRFQLFALTVGCVSVRKALEPLDRTAWRPIIFTPADRLKVIECWLWLAHFEHGARLAKLIEMFLQQMEIDRSPATGMFTLRSLRRVFEDVQLDASESRRSLDTEKQAFIRAFMITYAASLSDVELRCCRKCLTLVFGPFEERAEENLRPEGWKALKLSDRMMEKVLHMHEALQHPCGRPVLVIGGPGVGKSTVIKAALELLDPSCEVHRLVPNALRNDAHPSQFDRSQLDAIILASLADTPCSAGRKKCLILDSTPEHEWIECVVRLAVSGDYVDYGFIRPNALLAAPEVKVVVECVGPLETMTPAEVSHFTVIHVDQADLRWEDLFDAWQLRHSEPLLAKLMYAYFESLLSFRRSQLRCAIHLSDVALERTFCELWDGLIGTYPTHHADREGMLTRLFYFCVVWSIGGSLADEDSRGKFDVLLREQHPESGYPLKGSVFHYYVDAVDGAWRLWENKLPQTSEELTTVADYQSAYIRSPLTTAYEFLAQTLMQNGGKLLLASDAAVGKSALLASLASSDRQQFWMRIALTQRTTVPQLRARLRCHTLQVMKGRLYPGGRRQLVCLLDDLHTAQASPYAVDEFARQLFERTEWFEGSTAVRLEQCHMVAAMRLQHCNPGLSPVLQSVVQRCNLLVMPLPAGVELGAIFTVLIQSAVRSTVADARLGSVFQLLAPATVELVGRLARFLPPTPPRMRYQFSLRTIANIVRSLCCAMRVSEDGASCWKDRGQLLRLWIHECYRETWDRLERVDYRRFYDLFNETISGAFEATLHGLCPNNQSPLFTDVLPAGGDGRSHYEDVRDMNRLITHAERGGSNESADELSEKYIVHREAVEHAVKVIRHVGLGRTGKGLALLGRPGCGRWALCQLAVRLSHKPIVCRRLTLRARDKPETVKRAFLALFRSCLDRPMLAVVNLDDMAEVPSPNEHMMELLSGTAAGEELSVLFCPGTDTEQQFGENDANRVMDWKKVRDNFHPVLLLPSSENAYRNLVQRYPSLTRDLTVNCVHDWTESTLLEISRKYVLRNVSLNVPIRETTVTDRLTDVRVTKKARTRESLIQSTEERLQLATHDLLFRIHYAVQVEAAQPDAGKRGVIATCGWYFELLATFERVLREKRGELQKLHRKFRVGIERIEDATEKVAALSEALEERQREIALFQAQLDEFLARISQQTQEADEQTEEVSVVRVKIGAEEVICQQLAAVAGADLQQAMPALNAAVAALDSLNKKDMNEIKSYSRPPTKVELVLEAVMLLLGHEPTWAEAKRQLGEQKFLDTLKGFDRNNISERTLKAVGAYVRNPELEPEKVGAVSRAARSLILWVRAIENYGKVYRYVGPKIRKMEDANASLLEKQNELAAAERKLRDLSEKLTQLRAEYGEKMTEKHQLEETARQMALQLERARVLVGNLAGERVRWLDMRLSLEARYACLLGDSLLAAGFLTYLGPVEGEARAHFLGQWTIDLETQEIPFTRQFALSAFLAEPEVLLRWRENGLPPDNISAENAIILKHSMRTVWIVDPQHEARRWLLAELDPATTVVNFDDSILEVTVVDSFHRHVPLVVENVNRGNMVELDDVFELQEATARSCDKCNGTQHPVYLVSREVLPLVGATLKRVNQLSFVLGAEGLDSKMLGLLVGFENPSLEERRVALQQSIVQNKQTLADLEDRILCILNESQKPLLEDEELYSVLESSQVTFASVTASLQQAEQARAEIEAAREVYRSCAARAALLYLVLADLWRINAVYRYSLEWYQALFLLSLEQSGRVQQVAERKRRIDDFHTYHTFRCVSQGLFENDRKLFAFLLCTRLLFAAEALSPREYNFLVHGARQVDRSEQMENPCRGWLSGSQWDQLTDLDRLPGFHGIVESFAELPEDWKGWYLSPELENVPLPDPWETNLKPFQKQLVVRCLRRDRIERCMTEFTRDQLGDKFINLGVGSLEDAFQESSPQSLVMVLLRGNSNPRRRLERLRRKLYPSIAGGFETFSMTDGRFDAFFSLLHHCLTEESWLYVTNCHLSELFLKKLHHLVAFIGKCVRPSSRFRLWLGTQPHDALPVSVLQNCVKLAYEEPRGIKYHMSSLYEELGDVRFKKASSAMKQHETGYKRLLFALTFFHGLLLERSNFGQLGWHDPPQFVSSDFSLAERLLYYALDKLRVKPVNEPRTQRFKVDGRASPSEGKKQSASMDASVEDDFQGIDLVDEEQQQHDSTPWQFIRDVMLEMCYGAYISSDWDRRIYETYTIELFHPLLLAPTLAASVRPLGWFRLPRDGTFQTYVDFIDRQLPKCDGVDVFGQHENANIKYLESRSDYMLRMLASVAADPGPAHHPQQHARPDFGCTKQVITELLAMLPVYLPYENALRIVSAGATPVSEALLAEVRAYNALLTRVRSDADCALRTLAGATNEPLPLENRSMLLVALQHKRVPENWPAGETNRGSLFDWALRLQESVQYFRRWAETGQLPAEIVLAQFTNPRRFLNSVLQYYSSIVHVPFEELQWSFTIFPTAKPLERIPIEEGLMVRGLLLENGSWDWEKQALTLPASLETSCPMPPVAFRPRRIPETAEERRASSHYDCPVFRGPRRNEESYVLTIPLAVDEQQDVRGWMKYNTALLLEN